MRNTWLTLTLLCLALLLATPGEARKRGSSQNIDFGTYTCRSFLEEVAQGSEEDVGVVMMWIDGYLSGVSGDTVLNWKEFERFAERLVEYCAEHGSVRLLDAAKRKGIQ
jgi:acid stress chaperone HdeB